MPRWGMTMTEGQLVQWLVEVGQTIAPGQEILEIETEKIANVLEASGSGILRRKFAAEQTVAGIGTLLGVLADEGVSDAEIDAFVAAFSVQQKTREATESNGPRARAVAVTDGQINVLSLGESDQTPAVLIHGFGGDLNSWLFNHAELAAARPVHALDLPAHGASSIPTRAMTVENLASAVAQALGEIGITRAHFIAHSLGADIAMTLARHSPGLVASLSLISPAGLGEEINVQYLQEFLGAERRPQMSKALSVLFADPAQVRREMVDDVLRFMRTDGVPAALRTLADDAFPGGKQRLLLRGTLTSVRAPVQIIWGEADRIIPSKHSDGFSSSVRVRLLPDTGHMAHLEQAGRVNELLTDFMASADTRHGTEE